MSSDFKEKLSQTTIAVCHHWYFQDGSESAFFEVIRNWAKSAYFLHHPFKGAGKTRSILEIYHGGRHVETKKSWPVSLPDYFHFIKDFFYSIYYGLFKMEKIDLYVCASNLSALAALFLKMVGRVKKVVFYTIDFVPVRFPHRFFNWLYHFFDEICVRFCDRTWNLTPRMTEARPAEWRWKQVVVPNGAFVSRVLFKPFEKVAPRTLVYLGSLKPNMGLPLVLEAMVVLKNRWPDIKLKIIGSGPQMAGLKNLTEKLGLTDSVEFFGYLADLRESEKIMSSCGIGLALYEPTQNQKVRHYSWYGGAGKVLHYLAAGLPVVITAEPYIAGEIVANDCGVVVAYSKEAVVEALARFFENENFYRQQKINARRFAETRDWNKIFEKALSDLI
jgi:glycosyltransferase involved in cell wall biosynthesis